jgi:ABC-type Fe3+-hydroxamate transport system substrate-binding protein
MVMKKWAVVMMVVVFLFGGIAFAAQKAAPAAPATMSVDGTVKEITDAKVKVERTVKGKPETMELMLDKPATAIKVGDKVKVKYTEKDGVKKASQVEKVTK